MLLNEPPRSLVGNPPIFTRNECLNVSTLYHAGEQSLDSHPQLTAYAISKAAVDKFVRDFVPTLKDTGVVMSLLDPGWLRTDLGGPKAPNDPSTVLPGALVPALLDDGPSGRLFAAQDYAGLSLEAALKKAG